MSQRNFEEIILIDPPESGTEHRRAAPEKVLQWRRQELEGEATTERGKWFEQLEARVRAAGVRRVICDLASVGFDELKGLCTSLAGFPSGVSVALVVELDGELPEAFELELDACPVGMVHWRFSIGNRKQIGKVLYTFARAGIWNHVAIEKPASQAWEMDLRRFAEENPNLVHSYSGEGEDTHDPATYSRVAPLPGTPLWRTVPDWRRLFLAIGNQGMTAIMRRRILDNGSTHTVGEDLAYHFVKPADLPPGYLDEICQMVESGGSVATKWVRHNLERAFLIGYVTELGVIVGNSSLKYPRPEYLEGLSNQAGLDLSTYLERGYTSVRPEYRGLGVGTRLLEGLTARVGDHKLFSLIAEDNLATQKIALRNQTRKVATFFSEKAGKMMGVWIPEWMIDA
jgi:GNAT superfamily N-acetyltransferase